MKLLIIGNSFGEDSLRYLHQIAKAHKVNIKAVNLYIGGCSLYRHYRNLLSDEATYDFQINGFSTKIMVSLSKALLSDEWDFILLQQCSPESGNPNSYEPYATALADYVRRYAPKAKLYINQTWTFETGAPRFKLTAFETPEEMFPAIKECYFTMARNIRADGIIPCGEAMYKLWQRKAEYGIEKVHRDGFHADLGVGRYLLALTVYATLTDRDVISDSFSDFDVVTTPEAAEAARTVASEVVELYRPINEELSKNAK